MVAVVEGEEQGMKEIETSELDVSPQMLKHKFHLLITMLLHVGMVNQRYLQDLT